MNTFRPASAFSVTQFRLLLVIGLTGALGCSADGTQQTASETPTPDVSASDVSQMPDSEEVSATAPDSAVDDTAVDDVAAEPALRCEYENPFSKGPECKNYVGTDWTEDSARADCDESKGALMTDGGCAYDTELGRCKLGSTADETQLVFPGDDEGACEVSQLGCEVFGGGIFTPSPTCEGASTVTPPPAGSPFIQPFLECRAPVDGEAAGDGPDGDVCTWTAISGCTEEGRKFEDYASCDVVRTQRPYYGFQTSVEFSDDDPRLQDAAYLADMQWVKSQVEAAACVCCHAESAPSGASGWTIDAGPLWLDTVGDGGLAMMAGLADSTVFGAYPPEDNNGFSRDETGVPTTDVQRMTDILVTEYIRRGFTVEQGKQIPPFGGPLYDQLIYEPDACDPDIGVTSEGDVVWSGGSARYLYILEGDAQSPGVPPNLDVPEGTRWLVEVEHTDDPIASPVRFGVLSGDSSQRVPEAGPPQPLTSGESYYLVALLDIGIPITRCLFVAP